MNPLKLQTLVSATDVPSPGAYRPYYTERNAIALKPVFDDLLVNPRNVFISASANGVSISTLQNRILYGLKWLAENATENREGYASLKARFTTRRVAGGVRIVLKTETKPIKPISIASDVVERSWFNQFQQWLNTAGELELFDSRVQFGGVVPITNEHEQQLVRLGAQLGLEIDINREEGWFKAMK